MPKVQFREPVYTGEESDGQIAVTVFRSGDVRHRSTVRCYTRQGSAQVTSDFDERPNTDASIISFLPGASVITHTSHIFSHVVNSFFVTHYLQNQQCLADVARACKFNYVPHITYCAVIFTVVFYQICANSFQKLQEELNKRGNVI